MKWTKIFDTWECVFTNVPFKVIVVPSKEGVMASLSIAVREWWEVVATKHYASVELAKSEVHLFILEHLALYSAQVHRECLEANVMTWRKLKEQLDQIPEDQLNEEVKVLDTAFDWCGTPSIVKADEDQYQNDDNGHDVDVERGELDHCDHSVVVEKGHYYLHTEL